MASQHDTNTPSGLTSATFGALRRGRRLARALAALAALGLVATIAAWLAAAVQGRALGSGIEHALIHAVFASAFVATGLRALLGRRDRPAWCLLSGSMLAFGLGHALWGGGVGDLGPVAGSAQSALHLLAVGLFIAGICAWRAPHRLVVGDRGDAMVWGVVVATLGGLLMAGQMLDSQLPEGVAAGAFITLRAAASIALLVLAALVVAPAVWSGGSRRVTMLAGTIIASMAELVATLRALTGSADDGFAVVGWMAAAACVAAAAWQRERRAGVTWSQDLHALAVPAAVAIVAGWALVGVAAGRNPAMALLAPIIALAVAGVRVGLVLREELRDDVPKSLPVAAAIDALTGLPGHRAFQEGLHRDFEAAGASGESLALALIDIDDFTDLNETFGHPEGDRVLAAVGLRLARLVRSSDSIARVGADQFAWVLRGSDGFNAWRAAERIRERSPTAAAPDTRSPSRSASAT